MAGLGAIMCILWVLSGLAKTLAFTNNRLTSLYRRSMNNTTTGCYAAVASALARLIGMAVFEIGPLSSLPPSTIGLLCSQLEGHCVWLLGASLLSFVRFWFQVLVVPEQNHS